MSQDLDDVDWAKDDPILKVAFKHDPLESRITKF